MRSKFAEVQCAFAVAEVRKITANLSQTCGFAVAEYLLLFCGICGCGIEFKFAVPSTAIRVRVGSAYSEEFEVKVGIHQGSVLSPLLFAIVVDVITENAKRGVVNELLYADDLVIMSEDTEDLKD